MKKLCHTKHTTKAKLIQHQPIYTKKISKTYTGGTFRDNFHHMQELYIPRIAQVIFLQLNIHHIKTQICTHILRTVIILNEDKIDKGYFWQWWYKTKSLPDDTWCQIDIQKLEQFVSNCHCQLFPWQKHILSMHNCVNAMERVKLWKKCIL